MGRWKNMVWMLVVALLSIQGTVAAQQKFYEKTLANGFRVMVYENHELPQVFGAVAVNAGAKHDPADATGMAHYLEHMLFKGTDLLGTSDFAREKPILDSITLLYDSLAKTKTDAQRLKIQLAINKKSIRAAQYAIPNEMDRMLSEIGCTGVNAFTTAENTVYHNTLPSHQLEKWMALYAHRFENPVLRLFQAELEIVYEEKNKDMDDIFTVLLEVYSKQFYKKHPYGQQTVIGTTEHLKNPPLRRVYEYFNTYYVPNNMALILAGDVDHEKVFAMAQKYFGHWKRKELPAFPEYKEEEFKGKEKVKIHKTFIPGGMLGFRTPKNGHPDNPALRISEYLLSNDNGTGSLDKLALDRKVMRAGIMPFTLNDYGGSYLYFIPKVLIQRTAKAEKRAWACMQQLQQGEITDDELSAAKLNLVKRFEASFENNRGLFEEMLFCFSTGTSWQDRMNYPEQLKSVTRDDVVRVTNRYFGKNCLALYSRPGRLKKDKLAKPPFEPVKPAENVSSAYYKNWKEINVAKPRPRFFDMNKTVSVVAIKKGDTLYHSQTDVNNIGWVDIRYKTGKAILPALKYLPLYLSEAGSSDISYLELHNKLNAMACEMSVSVYDYSTFIRVRGLNDSLGSALKLCHAYLHGLLNDNKLFKRLLRKEKRESGFGSGEAGYYVRRIKEYALFGKESAYLSDLTYKQMKSQGLETLLEQLHTMFTYSTDVFYSGKSSVEEVTQMMKKSFDPGSCENEDDLHHEILTMATQNTVWVYHVRKSRQTHVLLLKNAGLYNPGKLTDVIAFNRYYGGDMSSIVFQEVREFRSLAYTTSGRVEIPKLLNEGMYFETYAACQADKADETAALLVELGQRMPEKTEREELVKKGLQEYCLSTVPDHRNRVFYQVAWKRRGFKEDPHEFIYHKADSLKISDVFSFYKTQLSPAPYTLIVVGNKRKMDRKQLAKLGKIRYLRKREFSKH